MNGEIVNINELLHKTFENISVEGSKNANKIVKSWNSVLLKIKSTNPLMNPNEGENLADHSRVIDLKNGVLLIEADHPGWISLLQFHKKFILKGMQMSAPNVEIKSLAFRLKGNQSGTENEKDRQKIVRENIENRIKKEEKDLESTDFLPSANQKKYKTNELAPELAEIFADLKKNMMKNQ